MDMSVALVNNDEAAVYPVSPDRALWVHIARGAVTMNDHNLKEGDGVAVVNESELRFEQGQQAEVIVFDMNPG
jgi:hypothetical protein